MQVFADEARSPRALALGSSQQERRDSLKQGITQANERVAMDMLKDGEPLAKIKRYSRLAEDVILKLADKIGVTIA